jgi:hypothetical protein
MLQFMLILLVISFISVILELQSQTLLIVRIPQLEATPDFLIVPLSTAFFIAFHN